MAETSLQMFDRLAPIYADLSDSVKSAWLAEAAAEQSSTYWGDLYQRACVYLAAHLIATTPGVGESIAGGQVIREKVGQVEVSYSDESGVQDRELMRTVFGRQFIRLRRKRVNGPRFYRGAAYIDGESNG